MAGCGDNVISKACGYAEMAGAILQVLQEYSTWLVAPSTGPTTRITSEELREQPKGCRIFVAHRQSPVGDQAGSSHTRRAVKPASQPSSPHMRWNLGAETSSRAGTCNRTRRTSPPATCR